MLIAPPEVRLPSEASSTAPKRELVAALGPSKVIDDARGCERFARDESEAIGRVPDVVVVAERAEDVARRSTVADRCDVPHHAARGGTGQHRRARFPSPGGILLATHALAQVEGDRPPESDRRRRSRASSRASFTRSVEKEGLFYPPDPNSLASCMIGGNVAENAGRAARVQVRRHARLRARARGVPHGRSRPAHRAARP